MKKTSLLIAFVGVLLMGVSAFGSSSDVTIDRGLNAKGCIAKDTTFVLEVSFYNDFGTLLGGSWPFRLYSETGALTNIVHVADAGGISADSIPFGVSWNDQSIFVYNGWDATTWALLNTWYGTSWDGVLPDTINFTGASITGWAVTTDTTMYFGFNLQFSDDLWGNAFCIDSIQHADPTYDWLVDDPDFKFGGPYCWCVGEPADVATFEDRNGLPESFEMGQNYPNPFNMTTVIEYAVPFKSEVTITVYNVLGQKINTVVNEEKTAGYHKAIWDGTNQEGTDVASGLYFYKIEADNFKDTKKLMLLK
jgi:hypothetical protein